MKRERWNHHITKDDIHKSFNPTFTHKIRLIELKFGKSHIVDLQNMTGKGGSAWQLNLRK